MSNILSLKKRIKTAQNVSKTTRAMQMIAASKLKKAQNAALSSRPYVDKLSYLSKALAGKVEKENTHAFMQENVGSEKTLLIVISPDKGLAGGLITNLAREYLKIANEKNYVIVIGKKIERATTLSRSEIIATFPFGTILPPFDNIYPVSKIIEDYFLSKKVSKIQVISTKFSNIFVQKPTLTTILPIKLDESEKKESFPFELFEPNLSEILPDLLRHYLEMVLYQEFLESYLSEQAARMISMQNATSNAKDIVAQLTLDYNKVRQEKITNEILDITGGASFTYE